MNCKLITVASHLEVEGLYKLCDSAKKFGWDAKHVVIQTEWRGFGTKLKTVYAYLLANPEVDYFFFCDAYDVVLLGTMEEALSKLDLDKITVSSERGCWPDGDLEKYYPNRFKHRYNYLNSGLYFAPREKFLKLFEYSMPEYATDDQLWFTRLFLFEDLDIVLDNNQKVFNSHSFIDEGEYGYENGRIQVNGETPVLIHSNGRSDDKKLDELVKEILG